jgi:hypothetical protein
VLCQTFPGNKSILLLIFVQIILQEWNGRSRFISMAEDKIHKMSSGISFQNLCVQFNRFRLKNSNCLHVLVQRVVQEWRVISIALAKSNSQNELGDIISKPFFKWFHHFCAKDFAGMAGLSSCLWALRIQIRRMNWDTSSCQNRV